METNRHFSGGQFATDRLEKISDGFVLGRIDPLCNIVPIHSASVLQKSMKKTALFRRKWTCPVVHANTNNKAIVFSNDNLEWGSDAVLRHCGIKKLLQPVQHGSELADGTFHRFHKGGSFQKRGDKEPYYRPVKHA